VATAVKAAAAIARTTRYEVFQFPPAPNNTSELRCYRRRPSPPRATQAPPQIGTRQAVIPVESGSDLAYSRAGFPDVSLPLQKDLRAVYRSKIRQDAVQGVNSRVAYHTRYSSGANAHLPFLHLCNQLVFRFM